MNISEISINDINKGIIAKQCTNGYTTGSKSVYVSVTPAKTKGGRRRSVQVRLNYHSNM